MNPMWLAASVFLFSFAGIAGLLVLKEWEMKRNRRVAPTLREKADAFALRLHELVLALASDLEKLPPEVVHILRIAIHKAALLAAASLRFLANQAHSFADFVSHRRTFRRGAPRSEFLKKVLEHKNGGEVEEES